MKRTRIIATAAIALFFLAGCGVSTSSVTSAAGAVRIVAAENFYGDLAAQIGGTHVSVTSLLNNPNADPHEYESSPHDAVLLSSASLVILNGIGYDSWMQHLLDATTNGDRHVIDVATLAGLKTGDNPHVWYDISVMKKLTRSIAANLEAINPSARSYFAARESRFEASLVPLVREITAVRKRFAGTPVAETEPVFGYMLRSLGLRVSEGSFQHAIEEGNDPPPGAVAAFESSLRNRSAKALVYNQQTVKPITQTVAAIARSNHIPVIGVTETAPSGTTFQSWLLSEVNRLAEGLKQ